MSDVVSNSAYMKAWRARKELEEPGFMDRERAKARERQAARLAAKKDDPEFVAKERERKRIAVAKKRLDAEFKAIEAVRRAEYTSRPEYKSEQAKRMKSWKSENKDAVKAYQKQWREANAEAVQGYQKAYNQEYRERDEVQAATRKRHLKKHYGLTPECFNKMWAEQSGKCLICEIDMAPRGREKHAACIDHNHETGEIRGLLCRGCNHGIGSLGDSPKVLQSAIEYLQKRGFYGSNST